MTAPDPRQRRAEDLCALLEQQGADLFAAPRMAGLDPYADDFGSRWLSEFSATLVPLWPACLSLFGRQLPEQAVLQQCWSVAMERPLWLGMLYRAACAACAAGSSPTVSPLLCAEASRLKAISAARWRTDAMAVALMAADAAAVVVPDLGRQTALKSSLRLRYRLAHLCATGAALQGLIDAAAHQSGVTDYQRRVELARAVHGAQSGGRRWRPLREVEYLLLTPKSRQLVIGTPALWPLLLSAALQRLAALPDHLAGRNAERDRLSRLLASMMLAVRERRLDQAGADIARLEDSALLRQLVMVLRREHGGLRRLDADFGLATLHGSDGRAWAAMDAVALARLSSLCGRAMPVWWDMSAGKVAQQLAAGALESSDLPLHDLVLLRRGWCEADELLLIAAGKGGLLLADAVGWRAAPLTDLVRVANEPGKFGNFGRQKLADRLLALPDARPWLLCMAGPQAPALRALADRAISDCAQTFARSWGRFVSSSIGTPEWHGVIDAVQDLPGTYPQVFMYGLTLLADGRTPVAPQGFGQVMLASLNVAVGDGAGALPSSAGLPEPLPEQAVQAAALSLSIQRMLRHLLPAVLRWLVLDPLATDGLVDEGPEPLLLALAAHPESPLPLLDRLRFCSRPVLQRAAWRQRLHRVSSLDDLRDLTLHLPPQVGLLPWRTRWLSLAAGDALQRAVTLLACARRNGWWLRALHKHLGEPLWLGGLQGAIALLKRSAAREAAMLELVRAVGAELAPPLMAVFAAARRSAAPGHKLDASYTRSLRPKKSGGQRVILAPGRALKRVQRAVLDHLLLPLGSHACACGFVPGRSICDNAAPHVGQPVVVNADVSNCFPSVKWPLVLGVLRRDLGHNLGPVAVSMLVDICTAEGGLPVGAPTSPTLLNRVLWRSDEVLAQAAEQRGLRYTRYADDLTFSGSDTAVQMLGVARRTLAQIGLALDPKKTNIFRRGRRQMVTGLVVNQQVSVPRHIRRRLRAAVHRVEQGGVAQWDGAEQSAAALRGRVAFVKMVHAQEGRALLQRLLHAGAVAEAGLEDGLPAEQKPLTEDGDETQA